MLGIAAGVAFSSMEPPQQLNPSDIYPTVKEQANEKPSWYGQNAAYTIAIFVRISHFYVAIITQYILIC